MPSKWPRRVRSRRRERCSRRGTSPHCASSHQREEVALFRAARCPCCAASTCGRPQQRLRQLAGMGARWRQTRRRNCCGRPQRRAPAPKRRQIAPFAARSPELQPASAGYSSGCTSWLALAGARALRRRSRRRSASHAQLHAWQRRQAPLGARESRSPRRQRGPWPTTALARACRLWQSEVSLA